jgi:cation transport regulator ChaC
MPDAIVNLGEGETALFGYGSLLSVASLEATLGRRYAGPFVPARVRGWRRGWDVAVPNHRYSAGDGGATFRPRYILYLNVRPDQGTLLNGVVFVAGPAEVAALDRREWVYDRRDVAAHLEGVRVVGGEVGMYVGNPGHLMTGVRSPRVAAVRASYLRIVATGLEGLGLSAGADYLRSTDRVPAHLVIDDRLEDRAV